MPSCQPGRSKHSLVTLGTLQRLRRTVQPWLKTRSSHSHSDRAWWDCSMESKHHSLGNLQIIKQIFSLGPKGAHPPSRPHRGPVAGTNTPAIHCPWPCNQTVWFTFQVSQETLSCADLWCRKERLGPIERLLPVTFAYFRFVL